MSHNASGIFALTADLERVAAIAHAHLLALGPPDDDEALDLDRVDDEDGEDEDDDDDDDGDDDTDRLPYEWVALEPLDGWVHLVGRHRSAFDIELAARLSAELDAEVIGYEVQGCCLCFRLGRWQRGALVEAACSPEALFDPATLCERAPQGPLRLRDVESLAQNWLLDLGIPYARLFVIVDDLRASVEEPGVDLSGLAYERHGPEVLCTPFRGRLAHQGDPLLRPDVYSEGMVIDLFTAPGELDDEGLGTLVRALDRRARRYLLTVGGTVTYAVDPALRPRLLAAQHAGSQPPTFRLG